MRISRWIASLLCVFGVAMLHAGDLPADLAAKFLKVIVSTSGQGKIACADSTMKAALEAQGVTVDSSAMIIWCTNPVEAKMQKERGRLVIVGRREMGVNACIVLEEEGGRPKLILNTNNIRASKVTLSDAVMKIGEKL